jgi:mannose-1-phosphate guanylyltransferase/mannose-6-phosphate isomerase
VEKPDLATARRYLEAGNFFWNSGMFAFRASVILEEFKRYQPDLLHQMMEIDLSGEQFEAADYIRLPDISIDYAIMERTRKGAVLPSDFGWSDIGSWKSLYEFLPKDKDNNVIDGDVIAQETRNCFIMSHERLIATNHLDNLVIVETPDSIFVSDIDNSRNVKSIVARLKDTGRTEIIRHRTIVHAWGSLTVLDRRKGGDVTRLIIRPDAVCHSVAEQVCSLTVLEGTGRIGELKVKRGSTFTAAAGEVLQVENRGRESMVVIQVALSQHEKR